VPTKRIGILTAGGDCPGLNAVIRAVVKSALRSTPPIEVLGIRDGYIGLLEDRIFPLKEIDVSGILVRGGTILGTSNRDNVFKFISEPGKSPVDRSSEAIAAIKKHNLDGLIAIGGDGTLRGALEFEKRGVSIIGVPKTIDNDLGGTDITFGFDSALSTATDAVDRLHSTAESHARVLICEVMGRYAGWIALQAGMAGGGDVILIPEIPYSIDKVCDSIVEREKKGRSFSIIVVAEGAKPKGGTYVTRGAYEGTDTRPRLGGISHQIAEDIASRTKDDVRVVILGHLQRGGTPTAFDRCLATQFGVRAMSLARDGKWGRMVSFQNNRFTDVTIEEAVKHLRRVDPQGSGVSACKAVGVSFGD
jgi:ATP-dependent phosphofructokinase / diphosphate-dependent phosphofructokinase